jgi:3-methyladenine DNA glycosylase AlkD
MSRLDELKNNLKESAIAEKAAFFPRFFKSGPGEYGEGDMFIGVTVPLQRKIAKTYKDLSLEELSELINDDIHEYRSTALFILTARMAKADEMEEETLAHFYLDHKDRVNNWDLVDCSAHLILGKFLYNRDRDLLYYLAHSEDLWDKRKAIIATMYYIKKGQFEDTLKISEVLLHDKHDLIHKAVGWMLRVVGDMDPEVEEGFLKKHYKTMPRTMLRYAIEKFPEEKRKAYLTGSI